MMRSQAVGAGASVGRTVTADLEGSEFSIILASCACFVAELVLSEALYDGHVKILGVIQVVVAVLEGVLVVTVREEFMLGLEVGIDWRDF
jgi:hypothetical protein